MYVALVVQLPWAPIDGPLHTFAGTGDGGSRVTGCGIDLPTEAELFEESTIGPFCGDCFPMTEDGWLYIDRGRNSILTCARCGYQEVLR